MQRTQAKKRYTEQEAYTALSALCATCEYCRHDMMKKMSRWDMTDEEKDWVVEKLIGERFIDESRFARAFVRDKFRYNKWGKARITQELKMRGIAEMHIQEGLEEIEEEESLDLLRDLLEKKRPSVKGKNGYEVRAKLYRYAMGKGFAADDIAKVIGEIDCDGGDEDCDDAWP